MCIVQTFEGNEMKMVGNIEEILHMYGIVKSGVVDDDDVVL